MDRLPADLQAVASDLEATARAVDALADRLSDRQFAWQPEQGHGWSVAQCVEHLAKVATLYLANMQPAVAAARAAGSTRRAAIASTAPGRWFISSQEPPPTRRFKAPSKIRPAASPRREEVLRAYHQVHRELGALIEASAMIDVNATTFANPFLSLIRMRIGTGLRTLAAHERRHVWQAERVAERA